MSSKDEIKDPKQRKTPKKFLILFLAILIPVVFLIQSTLIESMLEDISIGATIILCSIVYIFISFSLIVADNRRFYKKDLTAKESRKLDLGLYAKALMSRQNWIMVLLILITIYSLITVTYLANFFDG